MCETCGKWLQKIYGIGIDVLRTKRIHRILSSNTSLRFLDKVLSKNEKLQSEDLIFEFQTNPQKLEKLSQFVANRWAAKEAMVKALNHKDLQFTKLTINKGEAGKPEVEFDQDYWEELGRPNFEISVSHEEDITVVVALCLKS